MQVEWHLEDIEPFHFEIDADRRLIIAVEDAVTEPGTQWTVKRPHNQKESETTDKYIQTDRYVYRLTRLDLPTATLPTTIALAIFKPAAIS